MKKDDITIVREVQKNAEEAIRAIDTVSGKVYDDGLTMQLAKEMVKFSEVKNKALSRLAEAKAGAYQAGHFQNLMLEGELHSKTILNTSTSHIAELMIQRSNKGITELCKVLNHNEDAGKQSVELAEELIAFEEENIVQLKNYL